MLVSRARKKLSLASPDVSARFASDMRLYPIAEHVKAANAQHYEVPSVFFETVLGPHLKYSCARYESPSDTLADAEARALAETCVHADLKDGQSILELGCGWGSATLWMASHYPNAQITAVSNSTSQRTFIMERARARNLNNITVLTADMNAFQTDHRFDRIVSIEMFEHMANWRALLERCKLWVAPGGRLFLHVFAHYAAPYRFDVSNRSDWIAQHFFTGGIMPSQDLAGRFPDLFTIEKEWRWSGVNYQHTARAWLANFDANITRIRPILRATYGSDARLWEHRWRLFFLATAGLFGHADGSVWGVSHHLLKPTE